MDAKTILLVDDNPANLKLMAEHLLGRNLKVAITQSGEKALQRLQRKDFPSPDLILLDVIMPGIDGYETCRRIKLDPDLQDIPIIFLSAASETDEMVDGFSVGAVDYITKPINIPEVMARIDTHLELAGLRKELDRRINERTQELVKANEALHREIEERKRVESQVRYIATHDSLTDLPNRIMLIDRLKQLISMAKRHDEKIALMFLDLDNFKVVNDSLGHRAGDQILSDVADRLKNTLREEDVVARLGGDEFVACLPTHEKDADIMLIARKVLNALREPFVISDMTFHIGASIGVAVFPEHGTDVDALLSKADTAMYHAKQSGKAEIKFYTDELRRSVEERINLNNLLIEGMKRDELFLEYQPQINMKSGELKGAESLMRWRRENGVMISPVEFIPIAEANGLIKDLGAWGLRESCAQLSRWPEHLSLSVNISVSQLHSEGFTDLVKNTLQEFQIEPSRLKLEITESLLMHYSKSNVSILHALDEMGIGLSVDDFGTGYSSLAYLQDFPVSELKIDRSFVTNIGTEQGNAIPRAIIAMAHSLGLEIVAEGIEQSSQEDFLKTLNCDYGQGFLYSHSLSGEKFSEKYINGGREAFDITN